VSPIAAAAATPAALFFMVFPRFWKYRFASAS
jgi:hypothetical protein